QSICAYCGFDPTADSLHVGHLIPIMGLAHLQRQGHRIIALMGGGTAMVGDPSGKTEMRKMLTEEQLQQNIQAIRPQFGRFLRFDENNLQINNSEWLRDLNYLDFLREIGRHFSVNRMLSFETYKARLETGLSFLEFNYQLLQAYDFLELKRRYGCTLQLGGDDQWANIISGVNLIRRVDQHDAYGFTYPLLTTASGKKMGKTESGAIWLDPARTSPYEYYQYWVNLDDADVAKCLRLLTYLSQEQVQELEQLEGADIRKAKAVLAFETTSLAHGEEEARKAEKGAQAVFGGGGDRSQVPATEILQTRVTTGILLLDLFVEVGMCPSRSEARRLLQQGGLYLNQERVEELDAALTVEHFVEGEVLLRAGKKRYHRIFIQNGSTHLKV
ncbi:MAG: tyrosine--tRNA ligase, partial [SAR324 cluster bacterium]|nr:tyrosine--tRNA ligase [SAR324 cluster bacterium]